MFGPLAGHSFLTHLLTFATEDLAIIISNILTIITADDFLTFADFLLKSEKLMSLFKVITNSHCRTDCLLPFINNPLTFITADLITPWKIKKTHEHLPMT